MKTALLAGATGLIGQRLLTLLLHTDHYSQVKVITRRPLSVSHSKLTVIETHFDALADHEVALIADDVYCCLGTTQKTEGGGAAGRAGLQRVDRDYVVQLAQALQAHAQQFLVISALAANAKSSVFYNRTKGEMEQALQALDYKSLHIFRPSLLLGPREKARPQDQRRGEAFWQQAMPLFNGLMAGKFSRYRPTPIDRVAAAMLDKAIKADQGQHIYHFYSDRVKA